MLDPSISDPERVLAFWFPFGLDADAAAHGAWFRWAFGGGADAEIRQRFVPVLEAAAAGKLDGWAVAPRARLALIVVLDQFSRTVWQGDARAYAQDARARELALEGIACGCFPIAGDLESFREWITPNENGLLFDPTDPQSVAHAILTAIENKNLRQNAAGLNQEMIITRAEYKQNMQRAEEFYRRVVK